MPRTILAVALLVLSTAPLLAQVGMPTGPIGPTREQREREQREEAAARRALGDLPDKQPASKDPWGKVRTAPQTNSNKKSQ